MNTYGISEKSYFLLLNTFSKYPEIEEVILFGSRAKGNYKKGSDIDLAIKGEYCNKQIAMNINGFVNEELPTPYHVDGDDRPGGAEGVLGQGAPDGHLDAGMVLDHAVDEGSLRHRLHRRMHDLDRAVADPAFDQVEIVAAHVDGKYHETVPFLSGYPPMAPYMPNIGSAMEMTTKPMMTAMTTIMRGSSSPTRRWIAESLSSS